jgi:hypothetical protein
VARRGCRRLPVRPGAAGLAVTRPVRRRKGRGLRRPVAAFGALVWVPRDAAGILVLVRPGYGPFAWFARHGHMVGQRTSAYDEPHLWVCWPDGRVLRFIADDQQPLSVKGMCPGRVIAGALLRRSWPPWRGEEVCEQLIDTLCLVMVHPV